jgi:membrane-bound lytic murein transglycosylase B
MFYRRTLVAALLTTVASSARAGMADSFTAFITGVKREAIERGISSATLAHAFAGVHANTRVIELDKHQPEFTMTWEQYRRRIVTASRIAQGHGLLTQHAALLRRVRERYGVPPEIIVGIWGLESDYGRDMGSFNVIEALATLAWEGRRGAFFRAELLTALRILEDGDVRPEQMIGSYAGAMGQTQFMPTDFVKYAVDFDGSGRRDIWNDLGCVFASTANYLAREGWQNTMPWGERVRLPAGFDTTLSGPAQRRPLGEWLLHGVLRTSPAAVSSRTMAALLLPSGPGGEAFLVYYPNFLALRSYNPSDFYCISVGLIADSIAV